MPALNYDYDYYEYRNGRRVNSASTQTVAPARRNTTSSTAKTLAKPRTAPKSASTTKKNVKTVVPQKTTKKATTKAKTTPTKKKTTTKKSNIDIPITSSKKITNKPKEMTLKKPKTQVKQTVSFVSTLKKVALVSLFFALFFMICYRYSVINEKFLGIKKLKNELTMVQAVNGQLQADIESKTDLTYVENYAKYQLGMQKPSKSQIQYVNVEKEDKITTPVTIEDEENSNWFEKAIKEVRKIID